MAKPEPSNNYLNNCEGEAWVYFLKITIYTIIQSQIVQYLPDFSELKNCLTDKPKIWFVARILRTENLKNCQTDKPATWFVARILRFSPACQIFQNWKTVKLTNLKFDFLPDFSELKNWLTDKENMKKSTKFF